MRDHAQVRLVAMFAALALLAGSAGASGAAGPSYKETQESYELSNANVTVWFQGKKPLLKVFPTGSENASYDVHITRLAEFVDEDGDGAYDESEAVAFLNLARADAWDTEVTEETGHLMFRLTLNSTMRAAGPAGEVPDLGLPGQERRGNVTLLFHVWDQATTLNTPEGSLDVAAGDVKFDVTVNDWDWVDAESGRLALVSEVPAPENATVEGDVTTSRVDVARNGSALGHYTWMSTAQATAGNNTTAVDVIPSFEVENGTAKVAMAYNASGFDALTHDPAVGVPEDDSDAAGTNGAPGASDVPAPGALAALAAAGSAALLRWRGRRD